MTVQSAVVVGAGVLGAAAAYHLAARGVAVTLVEAGEPAGETSRRSFAWLNANHKPPLVYQQLNEAGILAHARLRDRLGRGPWLDESGSIRFVADEAASVELAARVERLSASGYPAEMIDVARAAELEPRVDFGSARAVALFAGEGWAHGPTLVATLVEEARRRGARVLTHAPVRAIEERAGGVEIVVSDERIRSDAVVVAAGRFSDQVAGLVGFELPLAPTCGLLAVTSVVQDPPATVVYAPGVHFRPDGDGRMVLQDNDTDAMVGPDTPETPDLPACQLLFERARAFVPALAGARIEEARVGVRPMPADGYPVVGPLPGHERVYSLVTHSGMTLGPLLGEIAAAEVVDGQPDPRLATFRPERWLVRA
jgi:glycine/D-amino acid oxidase-like deaminating enzyme